MSSRNPSWNDLARILKGAPGGSTPSGTGSIKSEPTSDIPKRPFNRPEDADNVDYRSIDTSDIHMFPPPKRTKEDVLRAKRDGVIGWVIKGRGEDGSGGVNIIKKDETLINLAFEGKTTLESQLKVCGKPVIGLDHIIEFIDPHTDAQSTIRVYHCQLCSVFRTAATVLEHVCSYHHRVRTLRRQFPSEANMFLLPDKKTINRNSALISICTRRAAEHELVYGRGEIQVRNERPTFPEKDIDAEESDEIVIVDTKQLEYLETTLKEMKTLKIQTQEEARVAKKIIDLLTDKLCEFTVDNQGSDSK